MGEIDICDANMLSICRPCHSTVHHVATNEELAREYFDVERLLEREDIQKWGMYAGRQGFGVKRG